MSTPQNPHQQAGPQPQYGQPSYGQPSHGQPSYGRPSYGQPSYGQPQYGQPQYGPPQIPQQYAPPGVPGYAAYPQGSQPVAPPNNGFGVTALVLGLVGVVFAWIPIIGVIAWPLVILGLIFGILGINRARSGAASNKGMAVAGTVLSAIGLLVCIVWVVFLGAAASDSSTYSGTDYYGTTYTT